MKRKILIIGLGVFGRSLAIDLSQRGIEVVAVDIKKHIIDEVADEVAIALKLDATDERALTSLGIDGIDIGIACIGESFEANLLAAVNMKNHGIPEVIARVNTPIQLRILQAVGIEKVISPEQDAARALTLKLIHGDDLDTIALSDGYIYATVGLPDKFADKTLKTLDLRSRNGLNLIKIRRTVEQESEVIMNPDADTLLLKGDDLCVVGLEKDIVRFRRIS